MVLAPLQKLKIKYELSYQSTTRLNYIHTFDQWLIIHQWTSTVDSTVRSLIHFTIFIRYYVVKHFPSLIKKTSLNNWCPIKIFIVLHVWILFTWQKTIAVTILHKIHYSIEVLKKTTTKTRIIGFQNIIGFFIITLWVLLLLLLLLCATRGDVITGSDVSHVTGSDISLVTGSGVSLVTGSDP